MTRFLVTGASRGIGRAVADALLAGGNSVVACARNASALETLRAVAPDRVETLAGDLRDEAHRAELVALCEGGIGGGIFCAGVAWHEGIGALTEEALRDTFETNFFAPALLAASLVPHLDGGASLTFVSSTLAQRPAMTTASYAASKAALEAWTRALALELAPSTRVNAVAPGLVDTDMARTLRLDEGEAVPTGDERATREAAQMSEMAALHPLGRVGRPSEVAALIIQVALSEWMTGSVVTLDGGLTLR